MKKIILAALFLFLVAGVYGVGYSEDGSGFATFGGTRMCMSDGSVPLTGTWDFSNASIVGFNVSDNFTNEVYFQERINAYDGMTIIANSDNTNLNLAANANESGVSIKFYDGPDTSDTSRRLGQITGHGNGTGSGYDEMAWYTTNSSGGMQNRMKFWAQNDTYAPLLLTGAMTGNGVGIGSTSGQRIDIGVPDGRGGSRGDVFINKRARVNETLQIIGTLAPTTDSGIEIEGGSTPRILAYDRDLGSELPLEIRANEISIKDGSTERVNINDDTTTINNVLLLEPRSTAPTGQRGMIYYDGSTEEFCLYNGSNWHGILYNGTCS